MLNMRWLAAPAAAGIMLLAAWPAQANCGGSHSSYNKPRAATTTQPTTHTTARTSVYRWLADNPDYSDWYSAVYYAGLDKSWMADNGWTVFVPSNEAIAKLPAGVWMALTQPENKALLAEVVRYHVVGQPYTTRQWTGAKTVTFANGDQWSFTTSSDGRYMIGNGYIVEPDITVGRARVNVVDTIFLPMNVIDKLENRGYTLTAWYPDARGGVVMSSTRHNTADAMDDRYDDYGADKDKAGYGRCYGPGHDHAGAKGSYYHRGERNSDHHYMTKGSSYHYYGNSDHHYYSYASAMDRAGGDYLRYRHDPYPVMASYGQRVDGDVTVYSWMEGQPRYSGWWKAVNTAGLTTTFGDGTQYTVFVPSNAAIAALPAGVWDTITADKQLFAEVVRYNTVRGSYDPLYLSDNGGRVYTAYGVAPRFVWTDDGFMAGPARVLDDGYILRDGRVYTTDRVLFPPTVLSALENKGYTMTAWYDSDENGMVMSSTRHSTDGDHYEKKTYRRSGGCGR